MKILLVHPHDSVEVGAWAGTRWDLVIDLGWSGRHAYAQQTERLGCRVFSIQDFLDHDQNRRLMRDTLAVGLDQMVDSESVDWWEVFSPYALLQLQQLILLSALAGQIPPNAEIFATRYHFVAHALSLLLNHEVKSFSVERTGGPQERSRRYLQAAFALRPAQIVEIAFDKWDSDYRLRRHFVPAPATTSTPVTLLPSAYVNVTRAQLAYARMLPNRRFLLVVTRRSGRLKTLPDNVDIRSLASYATRSLSTTEQERAHLLQLWQVLQNDRFATHPILGLAGKLRVFDGFAVFLKWGLRVRDAWREVFVREPITTVLSADEYNPYTRLPILLARARKLRTVFCDHGALGMSFGIRRPVSDAYLMKGEMARDYAISWCGLSPDKIVVGGPAETSPPLPLAERAQRARSQNDWIVFYSEAYELSEGRAQALYAGLLPELCALARRTNRKVIIKLHPFESYRVRKLFVDKALSAEQQTVAEIRQGPMTPDLFARAWCSLTVESSVTVESTLHGVPCFLCSWFDASWYDYGKQFAKFSAGYPLAFPQQIREIPSLIEQFQITEATRRRLHATISAEQLESVLSGK